MTAATSAVSYVKHKHTLIIKQAEKRGGMTVLITHPVAPKRARHISQRSFKYQCWFTNLLALVCLIGVYKRNQNLATAPSRDNHDAVLSNTSIPCQWIVLAGDSNTRGAYYGWQELEMERNHSKVVQAEWKNTTIKPSTTHDDTNSKTNKSTRKRNLLDCTASTWRWVDNEMALVSTPASSQGAQTCRIVTFKFLTNQHSEINRLSNLLQHSSHYCPGYELENIVPPGFFRPAIPDSIYLSHGFWGLPMQGFNATSTSGGGNILDCATRFQPHINMIKSWMDQSIKSISWQTLFPVNEHPTVTNDYLAWDYHCQLEQAKQHGLSDIIVDMYNIVEPRMEELIRPNNYHFKDYKISVETFLSRCCGGWDAYFGNA